jgi:glyoxylase-like metal-dependent hydrolase (beta-lactamase superfamily II)
MNLKRTFLQSAAAAVLSLLLAACARNEDSSTAPAAAQPSASRTEQQVIDAAAAALGGAERLQSLRNFTLVGYGQYAYQHGGGNITGLPGAPQKYQAANDLKRVYDLENNRWRLLERRNFLFPFAIYFGHDFNQVNQVLDGDIAYNVGADGKAARVGSTIGIGADGPRERRMWMLTNPVTAVRAALDPANKLSNVRDQGEETLVDLTLSQGDRMTIAFSQQTGLPNSVAWQSPHGDLGEVTYKTGFYGYMPFSGLQLPMGYATKLDWRDIDYFKMYVDTYLVDTQIDDMAAPAAVAQAPEPVAEYKAEITPIARGLWRITGGTMVIEFDDHMTLFEINGGPVRAEAVIAAARTIKPEKPLTELIVTHHHFDHTAGLRTAVGNGLTIISRRDNEVIFREMTSRPTPNFPDALGRNPQAMKFIPVDDTLQLKDGTSTIDLYHVINNNHMADALFAYMPEHKMTLEADIATAAVDLQWWGDSYRDNVEFRKLDVVQNVPVHLDVMSYGDTLKMVEGGIKRVKEFCAGHLAKGNYFPGCPAAVR